MALVIRFYDLINGAKIKYFREKKSMKKKILKCITAIFCPKVHRVHGTKIRRLILFVSVGIGSSPSI
jgi:hypothetical protein